MSVLVAISQQCNNVPKIRGYNHFGLDPSEFQDSLCMHHASFNIIDTRSSPFFHKVMLLERYCPILLVIHVAPYNFLLLFASTTEDTFLKYHMHHFKHEIHYFKKINSNFRQKEVRPLMLCVFQLCNGYKSTLTIIDICEGVSHYICFDIDDE